MGPFPCSVFPRQTLPSGSTGLCLCGDRPDKPANSRVIAVVILRKLLT
jgi:hypothetical protein